MVAELFRGYRHHLTDGTTVIVDIDTDGLVSSEPRNEGVTLTVPNGFARLTHDEAVRLATDLLRARNVSRHGSG